MIEEEIMLVSYLLLTFGWGIHFLSLMNRIELKRHRETSIMWFVHNRSYKFALMIVMPIPLAFLTYFMFDPYSLDPETVAGRTALVTYFALMLMTGAGSNEIIDRIGVKNALVEEEAEDDFETRAVTQEERDKILGDCNGTKD